MVTTNNRIAFDIQEDFSFSSFSVSSSSEDDFSMKNSNGNIPIRHPTAIPIERPYEINTQIDRYRTGL